MLLKKPGLYRQHLFLLSNIRYSRESDWPLLAFCTRCIVTASDLRFASRLKAYQEYPHLSMHDSKP
jgi:hypothetical protein